MNSLVGLLKDALLWVNGLFAKLGDAGPFVTLLLLLLIAAAVGVVILLPVLWEKIRFGVLKKGSDLGPLYGNALLGYLTLGLLVALISMGAWWHGGGTALCGGVVSKPSSTMATAPSGPSPSTASARFVSSDLYPWRDLCAPAALTTVGAAPAAGQSAGAVETMSVLWGGLILLLAPLAFWLAVRLNNRPLPFGRGFVKKWGHIRWVDDEAEFYKAAPWLSAVGWFQVRFLYVPLLLLSCFYLPLFRGAGGVRMPIWIWGMSVGALFLYCGLLLAGGHVRKSQADKQEAAKAVDFKRRAWEEFVKIQGFILLRGDVTQPVPVPAPVKKENDPPNLMERVPENDPGAPGPGQQGERFKYIFPPSFSKKGTPVLWAHQAIFIRVAQTRVQTNEDKDFAPGQALLMHTERSSGRTEAVFQVAVRVALENGRTSMLLYPNTSAAERAIKKLNTRLGASTIRNGLRCALAKGKLGVDDDVRVLVASVDWIVDELLPSFRQRSLHEATYRWFMRELGFIALEDIEKLSGVRGTNMVLVMRRLYRLLAAYETNPCLAMTVCGNPSRASGVTEFAQRLAGPLSILAIAERTDAPGLDLHTYLLEAAPVHPEDAQSVDSLPALAQLGLVSRAWGAPTHLGVAESIRRNDIIPPRWVLELAEKYNNADDMSSEGPFKLHHHGAWLRLEEVRVGNVLSFPEHIRTGGIFFEREQRAKKEREDDGTVKTFEKLHLVVTFPHFQHRGVVRFLLEQLICLHEKRPRGETVWRQLRRLGVRLVNGEASDGLLKKHLLAAMTELPSTEDELAQLLPDSRALKQCIENLDMHDELRREAFRRLSDDGDRLVHGERLIPRTDLPLNTPLDTITMHDAQMRRVGSGDVLRRVDIEHALRVTYPGMIFSEGAYRYRVVEERYPEFLDRLNAYNKASPQEKDPGEVWLACDLDDSVAFTSSVVTRSLEPMRLDGQPLPVRDVHKTVNHQGGAVIRWRTRVKVTESFRGRLECNQSPDGRVRRSYHEWLGTSLAWSLPMEALVLSLSGQELTVQASTTLRRMMETAIQALARIETHALIVHVEPTLEELCAPPIDGRQVAAKSDPAVLLLAPYNGDAGLLDALGASPWGFVNNVLRFVWTWANYLERKGDITWDDIGHVGALMGDESVQPDPSAVVEFSKRLLGEWVPKSLQPVSPWDPALHDSILPDLPTSAPSPGTTGNYAVYTPAEETVIQVVEDVFGEVPETPTVEHLCLLYDWMHRHIAYETDQKQYDQPEYIASPKETLESRKGDCEDHALLIGSMLMAIGLHVRTVILQDHALCQVYIGPSDGFDREALADLIQEFQQTLADSWDQEFGRRPYLQGVLCEGWSVVEDKLVREDVCSVNTFEWEGLLIEESDGELWLVLDTAMAGVYPGHAGGLADGYWLDNSWTKENVIYQYPDPEKGEDVEEADG